MQQRVRFLRAMLSTLRCSSGSLVDATSSSFAAVGADALHMHRAAAAQVRAASSLASAAAVGQQQRSYFAATPLMSSSKGEGGTAPGGGGSAQPPAPPPAAGSVEAGDVEEEAGDDEEAAAAMADAFERLIQAAFEMVQQGKPMEAEYVLSEGAKQAEEILGKDALEVSALYDQLALLRFLTERLEEAAEAAKRAMDILKQHDEGFGPATAIAATRYASALLALGSTEEAQLYTARSIGSLEKALELLNQIEADDEEEQQDLDETKAKFEMGLGESKFYHGLAWQTKDLSMPGASPQPVGQQLQEMVDGLKLMRRHLGDDSPIVAAALREHGRPIMQALEEDKLELAEVLYQQDARLHMEAGSHFEHVALTLYQCGTLQYVMGKYHEAATSLEQSLQAVRAHTPDAAEHMLTVQQRLGMVQALLGRFDVAKELLHEVAPPLREALGEGNPASEELEFMLSLISLKEMQQDGVNDPIRRLECLAAMEKHLKALNGYGEEHMLVKKAAQLYGEAAALVHKK